MAWTKQVSRTLLFRTSRNKSNYLSLNSIYKDFQFYSVLNFDQFFDDFYLK